MRAEVFLFVWYTESTRVIHIRMRFAFFAACLLVGVFFATSNSVVSLGARLAEQVFRPAYFCIEKNWGEPNCISRESAFHLGQGNVYERIYGVAGNKLPVLVYVGLQIFGVALVVYGSLGLVNIFLEWRRGRKNLFWYL